MTELERLTRTLNMLDLPKDQYLVGGSAVMVLNDIERELGDLDLFVTTDLWFKLSRQVHGYSCPEPTWELVIPEVGSHRQFDPPVLRRHYLDLKIDAFFNWRRRGDSTDILLHQIWEDREYPHGYPATTLDLLFFWKAATAREKDLRDLELISRHWQTAGVHQ
jgi:hypothetical protein